MKTTLSTKKMVSIKEQNYWMLRDFATDRSSRPEVQGLKLQAIYKLIQTKGDPLQTEDTKLKGVKVIQFGSGEYLGMVRTGPKNTFYPCALKTVLLTDISK